MHKVLGVISSVIFSFSVHGMDRHIVTTSVGSSFKEIVIPGQTEQKTLREILDSVVTLLSANDALSKVNKKRAEQIESLLIAVVEEFHLLQLGVFHEQGKIKKELKILSKNYLLNKSEHDTLETTILKALRVPRVGEITLSLEKREDTLRVSRSGTPLSSKNNLFLQKRTEFLSQLIQVDGLLQNELEAIEKVSRAISSIKEKIAASLTVNLERQQELHRLNEEKEKYRLDLSAMRHGCLLVLAILKTSVLKKPLTPRENDAFKKGSEIRDRLKDNREFISFLKQVGV
jgi:hypothetical protein